MTAALILGVWFLGLFAYGAFMLPPWQLPDAADLDELERRQLEALD